MALRHTTYYTLSRIDSHFLIKITDFGLSEDVFRQNYFRQGAGGEVVKLPVKWMAPESLSDGHFSEKSDVVCVLCRNNGTHINNHEFFLCLCSGHMV